MLKTCLEDVFKTNKCLLGNLTGRHPFLAITWEPDFFQACSFCRMLMNHMNFNFAQIPGNTNGMIFLKSPKTMSLGHFWPFLPDTDFFQKIWLCHTQLYMGPCHHVSQSWENLRTDGRMDGRTDRPYFIGLFRPRPEVQNIVKKCCSVKYLKNVPQPLFR